MSKTKTKEQVKKEVTEYLLWDYSRTTQPQNIEDVNVTAKVVYNGTKHRCYIKSFQGFLYNPFSSRHKTSTRNAIRWRWRQVSENVMHQYKLFVETKNELFYKRAERGKLGS